MQFESLIGQPVAEQILSAGLSTTRTSHAYLFYGPEGTGKSACAVEFARALQGGAAYPHPDILIYEPDGASFKLEQARRVQRDLSLSPLQGARRIAIIKQVEKMTTEAANSLLKLLEDPPKTSVLVLIATNITGVLPTVLSRCQLVPFRPAPLDAVQGFLEQKGFEAEKAAALAALSGGIIGKAVALSSEDGEGKARGIALRCLQSLADADPWAVASSVPQDRVESVEVLSYIIWFLRDALAHAHRSNSDVLVNVDMLEYVARLSEIGPTSLGIAIDEVFKARRRIERNCNVATVLELMFLKLYRILKQSGS